MMQNLIIIIMLFIFCFSIHAQKNKAINSSVIDVENGLKNLSVIKTSDLGKTVRYIPLETSDDCLIGKNAIVKVLKKYIVVEYKLSASADLGTCLLFSKEDGRFIAKIGHYGQDPEAYTNGFSWTDEKEEFLYFGRLPNQLVKYDMKGGFCGKTTFSSSKLATYYIITDSKIIGYFDAFNAENIEFSEQYSLAIFGKDGNLKDTVPSLYPYTTPFTDDIFQTNIISGALLYPIYGSWARAGAFTFEYTSARRVRQVTALHAARIWKNNGNIRFKQDFVDTIYTVSGSKLIPSIAFHMGKYHWPIEERKSEKNSDERIFVADIYENSNFIFFQCIKGMFSRGLVATLFNGLFNKKTGQTRMSKANDGIEDDLTQFMPFKPLGMSTSGEYISFVEAWEAIDWLGKYPEAKKNKKLSFLKDLNEEMNPIVILIE